jgi:hypothetical protein
MMIRVEVRMSHTLGFGELSKHGVRSEFALLSTETREQDAEFCHVRRKIHRSCTTQLLVNFRASLKSVRPRYRDPERQTL